MDGKGRGEVRCWKGWGQKGWPEQDAAVAAAAIAAAAVQGAFIEGTTGQLGQGLRVSYFSIFSHDRELGQSSYYYGRA